MYFKKPFIDLATQVKFQNNGYILCRVTAVLGSSSYEETLNFCLKSLKKSNENIEKGAMDKRMTPRFGTGQPPYTNIPIYPQVLVRSKEFRTKRLNKKTIVVN